MAGNENGSFDNATDTDSYSALGIANIVVELIIAVVSVVGNFFVLYAIIKNRFLRRVTNYYIASLAAADLLVGLIAIPFAIIVDKNVTTDFYTCLFMNSMVVILTQISIFALLLIAIERWSAIRDPYAYHKIWTTKRSIILISITWTIAAVLGMVPMFGWHLVPEEPVCFFINIIDLQYMVYFNFFGCVLPPLLIMFVIYSYIFCVVMKHTRRIAVLHVGANNPAEMRRQRFYKELRAAKALFVILLFFVICWLPLHILNSISVICKGENCGYPVELLFCAIWLSHANSAINPLLYAWATKDFRYAFKKATGMKVNTEDYPDHTLVNNTLNDNQPHSGSKQTMEGGGQVKKSRAKNTMWKDIPKEQHDQKSNNGIKNTSVKLTQNGECKQETTVIPTTINEPSELGTTSVHRTNSGKSLKGGSGKLLENKAEADCRTHSGKSNGLLSKLHNNKVDVLKQSELCDIFHIDRTSHVVINDSALINEHTVYTHL